LDALDTLEKNGNITGYIGYTGYILYSPFKANTKSPEKLDAVP
jgi:hypothetical protein